MPYDKTQVRIFASGLASLLRHHHIAALGCRVERPPPADVVEPQEVKDALDMAYFLAAGKDAKTGETTELVVEQLLLPLPNQSARALLAFTAVPLWKWLPAGFDDVDDGGVFQFTAEEVAAAPTQAPTGTVVVDITDPLNGNEIVSRCLEPIGCVEVEEGNPKVAGKERNCDPGSDPTVLVRRPPRSALLEQLKKH